MQGRIESPEESELCATSKEGALLVPEAVIPTHNSQRKCTSCCHVPKSEKLGRRSSVSKAWTSLALITQLSMRIVLTHSHLKSFSTAAGVVLWIFFFSHFLFLFFPSLWLMIKESFTQKNVLPLKTLLTRRVVVLLLPWFSPVYTRRCKYAV